MQEAMRVGGAQKPASLLPLVRQHLKEKASDLDPVAQRAVLNGASQLTADDVTMILPRIAEDIG